MAKSSVAKSATRPLQPRQWKAIWLLLEGCSNAEVCRQLKISQRTLWNWRNQPRFVAALREHQSELHHESLDRLRAATATAVQRLHQIVADPDAPAAACVSAAKVLLNSALTYHRYMKIEESRDI
jgi:hypothetical protein